MPCWCSKTFWRRSGNRSNKKRGFHSSFSLLPPLCGQSTLAPQYFSGTGSPYAPGYAGAPREHGKAMLGTQGDFPDAGKVTKGAPRAAPFGIPRCRISALFGAALTLAPGLLSATKIDRFATLSLWANRSFFSPNSARGHTFYCQSVARWEHEPVIHPQTFVESPSGGSSKRIHARAAGGMIMPPKGSTQRGGPPGRFFGDFLIGEKVTRGMGRSAHTRGCGGPCPHLGQKPPFKG